MLIAIIIESVLMRFIPFSLAQPCSADSGVVLIIICRGRKINDNLEIVDTKGDVSKHIGIIKGRFTLKLICFAMKHQLILPADREQILDFRLESSKKSL